MQETMEAKQRKPAGFWIRFCAVLIDLTIVASPVVAVAKVAAVFGLYIPIELAVIVIYAGYTAIGIGWTGKTVGKALFGIKVTSRDDRTVGLVRAFFRALLVLVFQCSLGLPFLVVGARRSKLGWHDSLTGTVVVMDEHLGARGRLALCGVLVTVGIWAGIQAVSGFRLYIMNRDWYADADAAANKAENSLNQAIEVSALDAAERGRMVAWLAEHGESPKDLVVDIASRHRVTIIGEIHDKKQYLEFLNRIIPDLYHKAGVRVLAMECCHSDQNDELARLVDGEHFDRQLIKAIARQAVWRAWGYEEYWDVMETVWHLNRSRPVSHKPLRVVGISPRFDGPSFALVRKGSLQEKLRIVRLIDDLPRLVFHDAHYAYCVEQEAFAKGERTVVWVGAAHAILCSSSEVEKDNQVIRRAYRMGSMLHGRYGSAVGQVILHNSFQHGGIARLIEECAKQCSDAGVAFEVVDSPFAVLRDGAAFGYKTQSRRCFSDLVCSYVMLVPEEELVKCDWMDGFLSRRMFGQNKPFYEMLSGGEAKSREEADQRMGKGVMQL